MAERARKPVRLRHGVLAFALLAVLLLLCVAVLGTEPQIPMAAGCAGAGLIAWYLGFSWQEVIDAAVAGIAEAMEAVLILLAIGVLVGTWILSGTVPTLVYYGLGLISPQLFLPITFVVVALLGMVLGSWGAAGTVGVAFMGIAAALDIPAAMAAGAVIAGAYVSEICSPLADGTNLCAAVAHVSVFDLCRRSLPMVSAACVLCCGAYVLMGAWMADAASGAGAAQVAQLREALSSSFDVGPLELSPLLLAVLCVALRIPAIPVFMLAALAGAIEAVALQGASWAAAVSAATSGPVVSTGHEAIDLLFAAGGLEEMYPTVCIVILVMTFAGIMGRTGLMEAVSGPLAARLRGLRSLCAATVASGAVFNALLPDQYPAIAMSAQMYGKPLQRCGLPAQTWANVVNSSAGICSVLVPWNTCAIYMVAVLGVPCTEYLPYALFCFLYPALVLARMLLGREQLSCS
ncbi:MAG: Na+/H+ antiporter NhaC family protein [Coriobacteriales bacterium]